jgi:signal transduction histidine kinase
LNDTGSARAKKRTPIALQIVGMMIAGMLLSQLITIIIVLFLPPQSTPGFPAGAVAGLLADQPRPPVPRPGLARTMATAPPDLPPNRAHRDGLNEARLAALSHKPVDQIRFYILHGPRWLEAVTDIWGGPAKRGRRRGPPADIQRTASLSTALSAWLGDPDYPFSGRFVAAARTSGGQWVVVRPAAQPLFDEWQLRLLLWLAGSTVLIAPAGYLFGRRISAPLVSFADAARRLGADPNLPPVRLDGPAELGMAADAFNDMQLRLRRYVADRTAMFSAISHDLRTPLARTRFKIERAPDSLRISIARDLDQMEAMIASVLSFLRDGAASGARKRLDLRSLLETVVSDAVDAGSSASLDMPEDLLVDGDPDALKRLFANLVSNATTYAGSAHLLARREGNDIVVETQDEGPGVAEAELERVFEPFYRADRARNLDQGGLGLGLAIARSIAREHGGDITLRLRRPGMSAVVRLPMAPVASHYQAGRGSIAVPAPGSRPYMDSRATRTATPRPSQKGPTTVSPDQ